MCPLTPFDYAQGERRKEPLFASTPTQALTPLQAQRGATLSRLRLEGSFQEEQHGDTEHGDAGVRKQCQRIIIVAVEDPAGVDRTEYGHGGERSEEPPQGGEHPTPEILADYRVVGRRDPFPVREQHGEQVQRPEALRVDEDEHRYEQ